MLQHRWFVFSVLSPPFGSHLLTVLAIMTEKAAALNAKLSKFIPEFRDCDEMYKYPMTEKFWCKETPTTKGPNSEPCFVPESENGLKRNYVYGPGSRGKGYYLLLTRSSYKILFARMQNEAPSGCGCSKAARQEYSDHDDVKQIMYNRSVGSRPDDAQCYKDAIDVARGTALTHYHFDQNYQLAVGAATTAAFVAGG